MPRVTLYGMPEAMARQNAPAVLDILKNEAAADPKVIRLIYKPAEILHPSDAGLAPVIDVVWLGRTQAVKDRVAEALTALFEKEGARALEITFTDMSADSFYDNGRHY